MKIKLLFIGIMMNCAGTEKSFLAFLNCLNREKYDVDLLLAKKEGLLLPLLPDWVNVIEMSSLGLPDSSDMFLLSGVNAAATIYNCFLKRNPFVAFEILPYFLGIVLCPKKKADIATRLWCRLLKKFPVPKLEYDVAVAYWGDRTMFYMVDRVKAKKKITWLHFDYGNPPRDDRLYLKYFKACNGIVTVSEKVDSALRAKLPEIADRAVMIENINNPALIKSLASDNVSYPDTGYTGIRILSVMRIAPQKGYDMAVPALARLVSLGYDFKWYIVGDGDDANMEAMHELIKKHNMENNIVLLGTTVNPYPYIKKCDIFLLPSRYEGKPITVEEAKILAVPIVVTNYLSANEQLSNGDYGIITDISVIGIFNGVKTMLDSPSLRRSFTERLSSENFGNAEEIEKFYTI